MHLPHTLVHRSHVVILDDIDRVSTPDILAELLTALEYRGPYYPVWVDTVYSRDGAVLYPAGHYYLKEKCYFIATSTHARYSEVTLLTSFPAAGCSHYQCLTIC